RTFQKEIDIKSSDGNKYPIHDHPNLFVKLQELSCHILFLFKKLIKTLGHINSIHLTFCFLVKPEHNDGGKRNDTHIHKGLYSRIKPHKSNSSNKKGLQLIGVAFKFSKFLILMLKSNLFNIKRSRVLIDVKEAIDISQ